MKIRSSLEVKQKSGEFVGSFSPYGYMKSPENKNQLIVDEAVSEYVQMIFSMYKDGFSIGRIAKRLNQMGVLSPMEYKHSAGVKFDTVFKTGDTAKWTYKAVQRILTNEVYIGVLAQGKRGTPNYKVRVVKSKDESEWVKVENAHEALVSYEDFMAVKVMMQRDMRCSPDQDEAHLFSGFLFCGDCQQPMIRKTVPSKTKKYIYYVCSTNKHSRTCSPHSIAAKEVEEKVFRAIHDQIELVINLEHALAMIERLPSQSRKAFNYEAQIAKIEEEIERYQKLKLGLYENFIGGVIDKSEYPRDTSKKVRVSLRQRGTSGKHMGKPPYGYRCDPEDKDHWILDEEAAQVVKLIFDLCIDGKGPEQIARILEEKQILTTRALYAKRKGKPLPERPYHWGNQSIEAILERQEYTGCTCNFKTYSKSYKLKKRIPNEPEENRIAMFAVTIKAIVAPAPRIISGRMCFVKSFWNASVRSTSISAMM